MRDLSSLSVRASNYQAKERGAAVGISQTPPPASALADLIDRSLPAKGRASPRGRG